MVKNWGKENKFNVKKRSKYNYLSGQVNEI